MMLRIALLLFIAALTASGAVYAAWTPPVNLTRIGTDCAAVVVATDSAGRVHALINRSGQGMWYCYVENDVRRGWQWLSNGVAPAMSGDGLGRVHAVWSEGWEIRYKRWTNGAWESETATVSNGTGESVKSDVCADSQSNVHVVWGKGSNVWYNRRSAATGLWDGPQQITFTGGMEGYLPPRVGAVGTAPVVVWGRSSGGNRGVWFSSRETGSWVHTQLPTAHTGASACDIDVTPFGEVHCTWDDAFDIWHARRVGGTWSLLGVMTTGSSSLSPRVSAASPSKVDLVWRDDAPGFGDMYTSRWSGASWSTPYGLTGPSTGGVVSPDIAHDFLGWQYAAYSKSWDIWLTTDRTTDAIAPPAPVASAPENGDGYVKLYWSSPDAVDLANVQIRYRTDHFPANPYDGSLVAVCPGVWGADSHVHVGLTNGTRYYYSIFACDEAYNWSPAATVVGDPWPGPATCWQAKLAADGKEVRLRGKVVSAVLASDACVYIQEPDRTSGIRVAWTGSGIAVGDKVDVSGWMGTRTLGGYTTERQISLPAVTKVGTAQLRPLGVACHAVGGSQLQPGAPGIRDGVGLHNMGLLVRFAGKVTKVITNYIFVDDGSLVTNASTAGPEIGVMVKCAAIPTVVKNDVVAVTGVVVGSIGYGWTTNRAYVQARTASDVVKVN